MAKFGLGTVQLGTPYGNGANRPLLPVDEATAILRMAAERGVSFFDTAPGYGESEARIGKSGILRDFPGISVSTKIPRVEADVWEDSQTYFAAVARSLGRSRANLGVERFGLVQFHQCEPSFLASPAVAEVARRLVAEGYCESLGVSVYEPEEIELALELPGIKALQVPMNLLDERFASPAILKAVRRRGVELIARSIYLQGLLIEGADLPPVSRRNELSTLRDLAVEAARRTGMPLGTAALRYVFGNRRDDVSIALIGVDSSKSLKENLDAIGDSMVPVDDSKMAAFAGARAYARDRGLTNPAHWNASPDGGAP